jgi:hypothetical protein
VIYAKTNPAQSNQAAIVRIRLPNGLDQAVRGGILQEEAGAYMVTDWTLFNEAAEFSIAEQFILGTR